ncbi:CLIP domain-containing serine protease B4-like [Drosophila biarmipes]|uniref:CLIP domain-containing serine protease B4-like n=1 Tax=Drosophila biarmipes TaxID=125945 RepID=UPI0021CCB179|nr:CLIP domain-containing serine protease B4-like [Drosophila biarmipes]
MQIAVAEIVIAACLLLGANKGSASLLDDDCGTTRHPLRVRRVVGGVPAERFANPWAVMVFCKTGLNCGGSLITSRFVLTAANCVYKNPAQKVRLGAYDKDISQHAIEVDIDRNISHPKFEMIKGSKYDIALLRMAQEVSYSDFIRPICLLDNQRVQNTYTHFKISGWGRTESGELSRVLQSATLSKVDTSICSKAFEFDVDQSQICTHSVTSAREACAGDGGSPLSAKLDFEGTIREFQFGIVIYGDLNCRTFGVSTNVTHYINWIKDTIDKNAD